MESDLRTAYAVALATSLVASVLTIVYVGGDAAAESNPVTAALIGAFGLLGAMTVRTLAVVVLYRAYGLVGTAAGIPRIALAFAWVGAAINALDALGNVAVALLVGPVAVGPAHAAAACLTVGFAAVALKAAPSAGSGLPDRGRADADGAQAS